MRCKPGDRVADRYEIQGLAGKGGMGEVYRAYDHTLRRTVAIKRVLQPDDPEARRRFSREALTAASLHGPHVACLLDYLATEDGEYVAVHEWLGGTSADVYVKLHGPMSLETLLGVLQQLVDPFEQMRVLGNVHRDVKLANLFIEERCGRLHVWILDFGVTTASEETTDETRLTRTGMIVGTPAHISPEQARGDRIDQRADVFGLMVTCFEALTGKKPFNAPNLTALTIAIAMGTYTPISELRQDLPPALNAWVGRGLAPDPAKRFASVKEMVDSFRQLVRAAHEPCDPLGPTEQMPSMPPLPRLPRPWGAYVAAICVVVFMAVYLARACSPTPVTAGVAVAVASPVANSAPAVATAAGVATAAIESAAATATATTAAPVPSERVPAVTKPPGTGASKQVTPVSSASSAPTGSRFFGHKKDAPIGGAL